MKLNELKDSHIVVNKNGNVGIVVSFNGKSEYIVFKTFITPIKNYNDDMTHKNDNYTIVDVYDGSGVENAKEVFLARFDVSKLTKVNE